MRDFRVIWSKLPPKNLPYNVPERWSYIDALTPQVIGSWLGSPVQFWTAFIVKMFFLLPSNFTHRSKTKLFQEFHVIFLEIFENMYNVCPKSFQLQAKHFQLLSQYSIHELGLKDLGSSLGSPSYHPCELRKAIQPLRGSFFSSLK